MSDIPPPLTPEPPRDDTIYVPFLLADAPRLQLDLLSRHTALPQAHRDSIREWLVGYNSHLSKWIHQNYGPAAVKAADALSRAAAQKIAGNQRKAQAEAERDLFNRLENDFKNE